MNEKNNFVKVVPLQRLPRVLGSFDYASKLEHSIGDLVELPFRKKQVYGVVVELLIKPSIPLSRLQFVSKLVATSLLTINQIRLSRELAEYTGVAWSTVLELCLPTLIKKNKFESTQFKFDLNKPKNPNPIVLVATDINEQTKISAALVKKVLKRNQQALLLIPEYSHLPIYSKLFGASASYVTPVTTHAQYRKIWQSVRNNTCSLIIGTRRCLFLPFVNLGGIVITAIENENYKQSEQNPRYSARYVAERLTNYSKASLALLSPAPPLEIKQLAESKIYTWQTVGHRPNKKITLSAVTSSSYEKFNDIISLPVRDEIAQCLAQGQKVLLYFNKLGNQLVVCQDCKYVPRCKICERATLSNSTNKNLKCYHCGTEMPYPLPCPRCGSMKLKNWSGGLNALTNQVRQLWPKQSIVEFTAATTQQTINLKSNLVIATRAILNPTILHEFDLVVLLNPETELSLPEFRTLETAWQTYTNILFWGAKRLLVQTSLPSHYLWNSLKLGRSDIFYQAETTERRKYKYPPYYSLCRLTIQNTNQEKAYNSIYELGRLLKKLNTNDQFTSLGPYPDYFKQLRGQYRYHILLKYNDISFNPTSLWSKLPEDVIIDRDPCNILS